MPNDLVSCVTQHVWTLVSALILIRLQHIHVAKSEDKL